MDQNEALDLLREQNALLKKQLTTGRVITVLLAVIALVAIIAFAVLVPQMTAMTKQIQESMAELDLITRQLSSVDLAGSLENVNALVETTMDNLTGMDLEGLNQAISSLSDMLDSMSFFFR